MRFLPFLTLMIIITLSTAAYAKAPINDEGAAKVRSVVQNMLDQQQTLYNSATSKFVTKGDIQVEQAKTYYAVTLPDITVVSQIKTDEDETKKLYTKIGIIGLNVLPTDNDKEWKMTVAIPTPIKYLNDDNKTLVQLDIGQQQMVGIWNEDLNAFAHFNGQYRDLILHNSDNKKARARIGSFAMKSKVTQGAQNLWSGPTNVDISNFVLEARPEGQEEAVPFVEVKNININGSIKDYSPSTQMKFQKLAQSLQNTEEIDPSQFTNIFPLFLELADSMAFKMTMRGLTITPPPGKAMEKPVKLAEAFMGFSFHGFKKKMFNNNFSFGWHGLSGTEEQEKENNTMPTTVSFAFSLDKLPLEPLINMGKQLANGANTNKDNIAQMAMMNAMMTLPQKLSEAGTTISIKDTVVKNPNYRINVDGHAKADQASIIGVNGELTVKTLGVNNMITLLKRQRAEASEDQAPRLDRMISQLETLQEYLENDPDGGEGQIAKFVLNNQGQTLVNGIDIKEVMGGEVVLN